MMKNRVMNQNKPEENGKQRTILSRASSPPQSHKLQRTLEITKPTDESKKTYRTSYDLLRGCGLASNGSIFREIHSAWLLSSRGCQTAVTMSEV